jgi:hypothetical protein
MPAGEPQLSRLPRTGFAKGKPALGTKVLWPIYREALSALPLEKKPRIVGVEGPRSVSEGALGATKGASSLLCGA